MRTGFLLSTNKSVWESAFNVKLFIHVTIILLLKLFGESLFDLNFSRIRDLILVVQRQI